MRIKATIEFNVPEYLVKECKVARTNLEDRGKFEAAANEIIKQLSLNLAEAALYEDYSEIIDNTSLRDYTFYEGCDTEILFEM